MRRMAIALSAAVLLVSAGLSAQAPNFAGKWTLVPDPNAAAGGGGKGGRGGGGGGFCGMECTITQDAKTLTVVRTTQAGEQKAVYNLDGSDSKNSVPGRQGGAPTDVVSKATVAGGKITIASTREFNGNQIKTSQTLSLDGGNMVIETSTDMGQGPQTSKQTFKKG